MEGQGEGTFEHTLIIVEEGAEVNYIEGCTAQTYSVNSMHSAVVEIFVKEGAQGPLHDGPELVQGRLQPQHQARGRRGRGHGGVGRRLDGRQVRDALPGLVPDGRGRARRPPQRRRRRRGRAQGHRRQGRPPRARTRPRTSSPSPSPRTAGSWATAAWSAWATTPRGSKARVQCDGLMMDPDLALGHLARHPDPEPPRHRGPRGRGRQDLRRAALLHAVAAASPRTRRRR